MDIVKTLRRLHDAAGKKNKAEGRRPSVPEKTKCPVCGSSAVEHIDRKWNPWVKINGAETEGDAYNCTACGTQFFLAYWG